MPDARHPLHRFLTPSRDGRYRMRSRIEKTIENPVLLKQVRSSLKPDNNAKKRMWQHIAPTLTAKEPISWLQDVRAALRLESAQKQGIRQSIFSEVHTKQPAALQRLGALKWLATFAIVAIVVRTSPLFFIAPPLQAQTAVKIMAPFGELSQLQHGTWEALQNSQLVQAGTELRTHDGTVTIVFHENGVLRLDKGTHVTVNDTEKRIDSASDLLPTFTLHSGRIWLQGFVPKHLRGLTVDTGLGHVTVHEGSVSLTKDTSVKLEVLDRHAELQRNGEVIYLIADEFTEVQSLLSPLVRQSIAPGLYTNGWYKDNLAKDAVHRREIALLQHQRLAEQAGILPTSQLHPLKRLAEEVDELLTIDNTARLRKQIDQANTRLNEAAALLQQGEVLAASESLERYQRDVARLQEEAVDTETQFLLEESLKHTSVDLAAVPIGDERYSLKKAVFEASNTLPDSSLTTEVEHAFILDNVTLLQQKIDSGDIAALDPLWSDIKPHLTFLKDKESPLAREAHQQLTEIAQSIDPLVLTTDSESAFLVEIRTFLPKQPAATNVVTTQLSREELQQIVHGIHNRVLDTFSQEVSQRNQLHLELSKLQSHSTQERLAILRQLQSIVPFALRDMVRDAIRNDTTTLSSTGGQEVKS